jgi:hypothetical protein
VNPTYCHAEFLMNMKQFSKPQDLKKKKNK